MAFLDVHMPGVGGIEAARAIARRAEVVFITAHEQYAVQAFEQGVLDYVVKPFDEARLADTIARLQARALPRRAGAASAELDAVLDRLASQLGARAGPGRATHLQWIRASVGSSVRLIPVEQIAFLRSDEKYTLVVWDGGEALIRKTIRELADELDPDAFAQVHRSVIVNLRQVAQVDRGLNETAEVRLKDRTRSAAGQPQLPARLSADVRRRASGAAVASASLRARRPVPRPCRRRPSRPGAAGR